MATECINMGIDFVGNKAGTRFLLSIFSGQWLDLYHDYGMKFQGLRYQSSKNLQELRNRCYKCVELQILMFTEKLRRNQHWTCKNSSTFFSPERYMHKQQAHVNTAHLQFNALFLDSAERTPKYFIHMM